MPMGALAALAGPVAGAFSTLALHTVRNANESQANTKNLLSG